ICLLFAKQPESTRKYVGVNTYEFFENLTHNQIQHLESKESLRLSPNLGILGSSATSALVQTVKNAFLKQGTRLLATEGRPFDVGTRYEAVYGFGGYFLTLF